MHNVGSTICPKDESILDLAKRLQHAEGSVKKLHKVYTLLISIKLLTSNPAKPLEVLTGRSILEMGKIGQGQVQLQLGTPL